MEYEEFESETERDPWWMCQQRSLLWLCIYKYRYGCWRRIDKNIALKIARIMYYELPQTSRIIYPDPLKREIQLIRNGPTWAPMNPQPLEFGKYVGYDICFCGRPIRRNIKKMSTDTYFVQYCERKGHTLLMDTFSDE
jgi:hypothetical protein